MIRGCDVCENQLLRGVNSDSVFIIRVFSSVILPGAQQGAAGGAGGAADHLHPPFEGVLALRSEVVDVGFKVEFEHVVFVDVLRLGGYGDGVSEQRKAGQRIFVLV